MKSILTLILSFTFFLSCSTKVEVENDPLKEIKIQHYKDSLIQSYEKQSITDTSGLSDCPIKVVSSRFVTREYSNYKNVSLTYKNTSSKTINAIKFEWYGENAFGEPADMGISNGRGGGFTDEPLRAGRTTSGIWEVLSKDGKKITSAHAYKVVFSDGSIWELKK